MAEELAADPPRALPVDVVHVSVFGRMDPAYADELDARIGSLPDAAARVRTSYLEFLERYRPEFGEAVAAVAAARGGGVLVHCAAGIDRTGLVSALCLRIAGVAAEVVADDYAASNVCIAALRERWYADAVDEAERERRRQLRRDEAPAGAMLGVLEELDRRHGSVDGYLRAAGLRDAQLRRLRERLRG